MNPHGINSDVDLDKIPDGVEVFERKGALWGRDGNGEFKLNSGSRVPVTKEEVGYIPCNAVLKGTWDRYGETRYCTGMAAGNFGAREYPEFCKHHQARGKLREQAMDKLTTGAFAKSYTHMFQKLSPHEQVVAIELFRDLIEESSFDYECEEYSHVLDMTDADWYDEDETEISMPVPTQHLTRGKALWFASLDFIMMEGLQEQLFASRGPGEDHEVGMGETERVVTVTESGREIYTLDEHHLNLTLSRITKDYDEHLVFGGVKVDPEQDDEAFAEEREYVLFEVPQQDEPEPEQQVPGAPPTPIELMEDED